MNINAVCFPICIVLLDFARQLDRTSDVSAVQVELRVEVLVSCDGRGVVRTGTLGHVTLSGNTAGAISAGVHQRKLQVVWVDVILWRLLPHCELCVVQQFPGRTAEESLSLCRNNDGTSSSSSTSIFCPIRRAGHTSGASVI